MLDGGLGAECGGMGLVGTASGTCIRWGCFAIGRIFRVCGLVREGRVILSFFGCFYLRLLVTLHFLIRFFS